MAGKFSGCVDSYTICKRGSNDGREKMIHKMICQAPGCRNMITNFHPFTDLDLHKPIMCDMCQDFLHSILLRDKQEREQEMNERTKQWAYMQKKQVMISR